METLDKFDIAILQQLQTDARLTNAELASRVGLSAAPCWRRVRALEESGFITGYRAEINRHKIGLGVLVCARLDAVRNAGDACAFDGTKASSSRVKDGGHGGLRPAIHYPNAGITTQTRTEIQEDGRWLSRALRGNALFGEVNHNFARLAPQVGNFQFSTVTRLELVQEWNWIMVVHKTHGLTGGERIQCAENGRVTKALGHTAGVKRVNGFRRCVIAGL